MDDRSTGLQFKGKRKEEVYEWIEDTLVKFEYLSVKKKHKSIVRKYFKKMTGYSKPQLNRLILQYKKAGRIQLQEYEWHVFATKNSPAEIALLAKTDELHDFPNGATVKRTLVRMYRKYTRLEYKNIGNISVGHIYNLRQSPEYLRITKKYEKTKPHVVNIGIRKKPEPNEKPGYFRVDTVHQGYTRDDNGVYEKGIYHINFVDEITQFEYVGAIETISEAYLVSLIIKIIETCPYGILGFYSDNGSEYINGRIARLLNKLLIIFTKSRSRQSHDNALVEGKNGSIIRKNMGYMHLNQKLVDRINDFYLKYFNPYLVYHRPCGYVTGSEGRLQRERAKNIRTVHQSI